VRVVRDFGFEKEAEGVVRDGAAMPLPLPFAVVMSF